ncbi:MAG: hypothetical protein Ct9H300mP9_2200 [Candidatus Neomarinimicrobiota bacterium]|nr:MAG: hypothetical protein Ct9H300mP9_2200 [Candidatus Neomarinimicrobiota bacterium]
MKGLTGLSRVFEINGVQHQSHLADPGRLKELLTPGADLMVRKAPIDSERKTKYSTVMVKHKGQLISLVSSLPNQFVKEIWNKKNSLCLIIIQWFVLK